MHNLIIDVCENSSPEKGICLSPPFYQQLNELKRFNTETIYRHKRLEPFLAYSELILRQLFKTLLDAYDEKYLWRNLKAREKYSPILTRSFEEFLAKYCDPSSVPEAFEEVARNCKNKKIYGSLSTREIYIRAIMDYISGMSRAYEALKSEERGSRAKTTKEGFLTGILRFLEKQGLIEYIAEDEMIRTTEKLDRFMDWNLLNQNHFDRIREVLGN